MGQDTGNYSLAARKELACERYRQEVPVTHIARELGVSKDSVYLYLKEAGVRRSIQDKTKFKNYISHADLQKIAGTNKKNLLRAVQRAEVSAFRIGTHVRYRREDVSRILEVLNADFQPEFRRIDHRDAAWLSGLFDAEGHADIHKSKDRKGRGGIGYRPCWVLVNTDKTLMDEASRILDLLGVSARYTNPGTTTSGKSIWRIETNSARDIAMICAALLPYTCGMRLKTLEVMLEWSLAHVRMGDRISGKMELYEEYVEKLAGLKK